jgi:GT2 family glycosyltransferase
VGGQRGPSQSRGDRTLRLAAVFVHYHAARWLTAAVASLRADLERAGLEAEIVVVDNGSRPDEHDLLVSLGASYVDARGNRGYAGALNLGVAGTKADYLFLLNADVELLPGCSGALLTVLLAGVAVAGPRLYWDRGQRLLLPPTEERTRWSALLGACAPSHPRLAHVARRRWRRHAHAHWRATEPLTSLALSGAFLAIRRDAWSRVGPFDEGFKLYFEETDWLERARRRGLRACLVPAARAVHFYNQSAGHEPAARAWFAASSRRFERRYYGAWFVNAKDRIGAWGAATRLAVPQRVDDVTRVDVEGRLEGGSTPTWIEISPSPLGFPAAAEPLGPSERRRWTFPADVWQHLAPGVYHGRVVDARGRESPSFAFTRS